MNNQIIKRQINLRQQQQQNIPKNPIIFFFTYLYRWFFYFLYKAYSAVINEKKAIVFDPVSSYIEKNKKKLLNRFTKPGEFHTELSNNMNSNIEKVFYNKKDLLETLVDQNNELEKIWRSRVLFENTPRGNIIMYYDAFKQGFAYHSDINGIPYNILNAVAMKYVVLYHCRDLFIDNEYLENEKESPLIKLYLEQEKENKKENTDKIAVKKLDDSAFAKLKNYKKTDINEDKNTKDKSEEIKKPEKEYNRNIFINLGKICNFKILQKPEKKSKLNGFYSKLLDGVTSEGELQNQVMNYSKYKEFLKKKST